MENAPRGLAPRHHQIGENLLAVVPLKSWTKSPTDPSMGAQWPPSGGMKPLGEKWEKSKWKGRAFLRETVVKRNEQVERGRTRSRDVGKSSDRQFAACVTTCQRTPSFPVEGCV